MEYFLHLLIFLTTLITPTLALAESIQSYALVVGIEDYPASPLIIPVNDAHAVAASLERVGFQVDLLLDEDHATLSRRVQHFYQDIREQGDDVLSVFYYAGHAVQMQHHNYLVPQDVDVAGGTSFRNSLFDVNELFREMPNSDTAQNIVILDACRNNPFTGMDSETVTIDSGLAPMHAPAGTLIAYSTEPGGVASDGRGGNSIYTRHLLKHLQTPVAVEEVFRRVRRGVSSETCRQQIPWEYSSLLSEAFINPPKNADLPNIVTF